MCKTTTPPRPAAQDAIRKLPPNTAAGAVIPLQSYLNKYVAKYSDELVPSTAPTLPPDVDPNAYKRVAFSILPLLGTSVSPYYAGVFDDDTDFSASLVKVGALSAAAQLLAEAKDAFPGSTLATFDTALAAEINANADPRIRSASYPPHSPVLLLPNTTASILDVSGAPKFVPAFNSDLSLMIVQSDDPAATRVIDALGYGYISAVLNQGKFFDPTNGTGVGIWLGGDYSSTNFYVRIPCINDHPDGQLTTTRQMCRLMAMIRLKQLPTQAAGVDLDTNALMQSLLQEPKGPGGTQPWLLPGRPGGPSAEPLFSIVHDKIGFDGLGTIRKPVVYSEGLIIRWTDASQTIGFNNKIDPGNTNPFIRLTGEFSVCWQNLLATKLSTGFDGIVDVLNDTISDFLDQEDL